ncbi:hypothetical protein [Bacteroides heparinolyticus]|uniref:hypothetical protein n=1 Tax=Prevotella heparinolytica TaxID=28113 RepID=UPI003AF05B57
MAKKRYYVTDIQVVKHTNSTYLRWVYGGREYEAQGEFYVDEKGYLHHSFITPRGREIDFKVKL